MPHSHWLGAALFLSWKVTLMALIPFIFALINLFIFESGIKMKVAGGGRGNRKRLKGCNGDGYGSRRNPY